MDSDFRHQTPDDRPPLLKHPKPQPRAPLQPEAYPELQPQPQPQVTTPQPFVPDPQTPPPVSPSPISPSLPPAPGQQVPLPETPRKSSKIKKIILWLIGGLLAIGVLVIAIGWLWYQHELSPIAKDNTERVRIVIEQGTTPGEIGAQLKDEALIRSEEAFAIYTRLTGTQNNLQAGSYRLSPSESTPEIVEHLTKGNVDTFDITFLPGETLEDHKEVFIEAGYTEEEIDKAFDASYSSPLFKGREMADLEGYIYGETYRVSSGATVGEILELTFAEFTSVIEENDLEGQFTAQGLTLREGIILASIIQRETNGEDEAQIAQVFHLRLETGMELGSDPTYQYIADKMGVKRDINLDSPYNTRRYPGLPPGPIASPGLDSLKAVGSPAEGDYLYFLSGDDDVTYYARTLKEHEANISNHCRQKCQII